MATPTTRKPLGGAPNPSPRRPPTDSSPGRPSSSTSLASTGQGLARSPSIRQARPMRRSTARMSTSFTPDDDFEQNEEEKNANAQIMADLKEQVQRAEQASEQYRKQIEAMQQRLDEATNEQTEAEEREFQRRTEMDRLRAEIKEASRQKREQEISYESEKRLLLQERDRQGTKEAELQSVIGRLNETLRNKGLEKSIASRAAGVPSERSSPDETFGQTRNSADVSTYVQAIQDKDNIIETLKLELAEFHLQTAEQEHMGDGRLQQLEKQILETKMQNARLVEENESFQMLLSEKTLKGDFVPDQTDTSGLSTLEEELESANDDPEMRGDSYRRLEVENKQLKEQNKGLTLYIDKIIGRILQHEGFEQIIVNKDDKEVPPPPPAKPAPLATIDKALPASPPRVVDDAATPTQQTVAGAAAGFLQRAKSVVSRSGNARPSRPISYAQPQPPTANENPDTAPSIPFSRGHRRTRSDQAQQDLGAAAVVQHMNRGSPLRTVSGGVTSPGVSPLSPSLKPQTGYFPNATPQTSTGRASSGSQPVADRGSSRNSITSDHSLDRERSSTETSSGPSAGAGPNIPGAVMKQNQLRPLRLVQERSREDEEAQKKANRGSWMGWFKGSTIEAQHEAQGHGQ